jgi:anti-sigma regulatory factor (Ser/Thr protein kinase)
MPEFTLPGRPAMVPVARLAARLLLDGYPCAEDAELIVAEAVTNSVRHSRSCERHGAVLVSIDARPGLVRIEVTDDGQPHGFEITPTKEELAESGRGLTIVDALTGGRWGQKTGANYRMTWAEIEYQA